MVIPRGAIAQETQHHPASKPLDAMKAASAALDIQGIDLDASTSPLVQ